MLYAVYDNNDDSDIYQSIYIYIYIDKVEFELHLVKLLSNVTQLNIFFTWCKF